MVVGEGGSGGALGIGVCDRVLILENAYYFVISPEGCAAILSKDRANARASRRSAGIIRLRKICWNYGVGMKSFPEPPGGAHKIRCHGQRREKSHY